MKKWLLLMGILAAPAIVHAADAVTISTQTANSRRAIIAYTDVSDGTGESAVTKLVVGNLPGAPSVVRITRVWYVVSSTMTVRVLFKNTSNDTALTLAGTGSHDYSYFGGLKNPGTGSTGDILFTTVAAAANATYSVILEVTY